jgi:Mor family transcriptional regulator
MGKPADHIPELIREWSEIASTVLVEHGLDDDQAAKLGGLVVRGICNEYAGQQFYLPVWLVQKISERDQTVAQEAARGVTINDIAARHKLTVPTVYAIIRRVAAAEIAQRQRPLFADD